MTFDSEAIEQRSSFASADHMVAEGRVLVAAPDWRPSTRYVDQPTSLSTRLSGIGGVGLIALGVAACILVTWSTYQAVAEKTTLSVFEVEPPAAPPEPQSEIPPGPEQVQMETPPQVQMPEMVPPEILIPTSNPLPVPPPKPAPEPAPPIEQTTAPEVRPAPPAQKASNAKPTWEGQVLAALNKVKRYPRDASFRRQQGVPYIRFSMNREGRVVSVKLERSSGFKSLDDEALSVAKRAQPLPKPPEEVKGDTIELVVPIEFFMR